MNRIKEFYRISRPAPKRELDDTACDMIKAHILLLIMVKVKYMWNLNQVSMITVHLIK